MNAAGDLGEDAVLGRRTDVPHCFCHFCSTKLYQTMCLGIVKLELDQLHVPWPSHRNLPVRPTFVEELTQLRPEVSCVVKIVLESRYPPVPLYYGPDRAVLPHVTDGVTRALSCYRWDLSKWKLE